MEAAEAAEETATFSFLGLSGMMHPDHWNFIVTMARAFVITTIVVCSYKLGSDVYHILRTMD